MPLASPGIVRQAGSKLRAASAATLRACLGLRRCQRAPLLGPPLPLAQGHHALRRLQQGFSCCRARSASALSFSSSSARMAASCAEVSASCARVSASCFFSSATCGVQQGG